MAYSFHLVQSRVCRRAGLHPDCAKGWVRPSPVFNGSIVPLDSLPGWLWLLQPICCITYLMLLG